MFAVSKPILLSPNHYLREVSSEGRVKWILDCKPDLGLYYEKIQEPSSLNLEILYEFLKSVVREDKLKVPIEILYALMICFGLPISRVTPLSMEIRLPDSICEVRTDKLLAIIAIFTSRVVTRKEFEELCFAKRLPRLNTNYSSVKIVDSSESVPLRRFNRMTVEHEIIERVAILSTTMDTVGQKFKILKEQTRSYLKSNCMLPGFLEYVTTELVGFAEGPELTWVETAIIQSCLRILNSKVAELYPNIPSLQAAQTVTKQVNVHLNLEVEVARMAELVKAHEKPTISETRGALIEDYSKALTALQNRLSGVSATLNQTSVREIASFAPRFLSDIELAKLDFPCALQKSAQSTQQSDLYTKVEDYLNNILLSQIEKDQSKYVKNFLGLFNMFDSREIEDETLGDMLIVLGFSSEWDVNTNRVGFGLMELVFDYLSFAKGSNNFTVDRALPSGPSLVANPLTESEFRKLVRKVAEQKAELIEFLGSTRQRNIFEDYANLFPRLYRLSNTVIHDYYAFLDGKPETILSRLANYTSYKEQRETLFNILQEYYAMVDKGWEILADLYERLRYLSRLEIKLAQLFYLRNFRGSIKIGSEVYSAGDGNYKTLGEIQQPVIDIESLAEKQRLFRQKALAVSDLLSSGTDNVSVDGIIQDYRNFKGGEAEANLLWDRRAKAYKLLIGFNSDLQDKVKDLHKIVQLSPASVKEVLKSPKVLRESNANYLRVIAEQIALSLKHPDLNIGQLDGQLIQLRVTIELFLEFAVPAVNKSVQAMVQVQQLAETLRTNTLNLKQYKNKPGVQKKPRLDYGALLKTCERVILDAEGALLTWTDKVQTAVIAKRSSLLLSWKFTIGQFEKIPVARLDSQALVTYTDLKARIAGILARISEFETLYRLENVDMGSELRTVAKTIYLDLQNAGPVDGPIINAAFAPIREFVEIPCESNRWQDIYLSVTGLPKKSSLYLDILRKFQHSSMLNSNKQMHGESPEEYLSRLTNQLQAESHQLKQLAVHTASPDDAKPEIVEGAKLRQKNSLQQWYCNYNFYACGGLDDSALSQLLAKYPYFPSKPDYYEAFLWIFKTDVGINSMVHRYVSLFYSNCTSLGILFGDQSFLRVVLPQLRDSQIVYRNVIGGVVKDAWDRFTAIYYASEGSMLKNAIRKLRFAYDKSLTSQLQGNLRILPVIDETITEMLLQDLHEFELDLYSEIVSDREELEIGHRQEYAARFEREITDKYSRIIEGVVQRLSAITDETTLNATLDELQQEFQVSQI